MIKKIKQINTYIVRLSYIIPIITGIYLAYKLHIIIKKIHNKEKNLKNDL